MTAELIRQGLTAAAFHADVGTRERRGGWTALANGDVTVLVCTDSAARAGRLRRLFTWCKPSLPQTPSLPSQDRSNRAVRRERAGDELGVRADADLVDAVRAAEAAGAPVEGAFSRKRSFRKKFKKYGPRARRRRTGDDH